jgi:hypothetical protein
MKYIVYYEREKEKKKYTKIAKIYYKNIKYNLIARFIPFQKIFKTKNIIPTQTIIIVMDYYFTIMFCN